MKGFIGMRRSRPNHWVPLTLSPDTTNRRGRVSLHCKYTVVEQRFSLPSLSTLDCATPQHHPFNSQLSDLNDQGHAYLCLRWDEHGERYVDREFYIFCALTIVILSFSLQPSPLPSRNHLIAPVLTHVCKLAHSATTRTVIPVLLKHTS